MVQLIITAQFSALLKLDDYFSKLQQETAWQYDQALIRGKLITTNRRVAWYGNQSYPYTYSGTTKQALAWTETLLALKSLVEEKTGARYNSCLVNLYDDGNTGMAWHSDNEGLLVEDAAIASLSFGAERRFLLRHKTTQQTIEFDAGARQLIGDERPNPTLLAA
jgi:alkylated DNA repair dioxygenase AlkB